MRSDVEWMESRIDLPGRGRTFYREAKGPPGAPTLMLLHGLGATGLLNWRTALPTLARNYRVLVIDHRGHGRGMRIRRPFRLVDCADDAAALAEVLGLGRFIAVGYSMGGPIAQLLWQRHRDRIAGLVLCATAHRFSSNERRRMSFAISPMLNVAGRVAPRHLFRRIASNWLSNAIDDPAIRDRVMSEVASSDPVSVSQAAAAVLRFDSSKWIADIDVPTSIVLTESDQLVPARIQRALAERIRGSMVIPIQGDHSVCVTEPKLFLPALESACRSVAERAGGSS
jgi:pimeloyl-ACP methyl ester carboxylesterase